MAPRTRIKAFTLAAVVSAQPLLSSADAENVAPRTAGDTSVTGQAHLEPIILAEQQPQEHVYDLPDTPALGRPAPLLSSEAQEMLKQLNLSPLLERITVLKGRVETAGTPRTIEDLALRQDLLDDKRELTRIILKTNLEVDYVLAAIDGELNRYTERIAELSEKRDKAVFNTTLMSQFSNGALWSTSSAFTVGSYRHPVLSIPDGVIGILAGAVPTALSLYAMHQTKGSKADSYYKPNMLSPVFGRADSPTDFFPESIVTFMNCIPPTEKRGRTRKQVLLEHWHAKKFLDQPGSKGYDRTVSILTATEAHKKGITIDLLERRQQMLAELRSEVFNMKRFLLELMQLTD